MMAMTDREKLINILVNLDTYNCEECQNCASFKYDLPCDDNCFCEKTTDYLIDKGVTVQESNSCEYCEEYEDLPEHFISGKPVGRVFDTCIQTDENGRWHLEVPSGVDIGIKFCPMCGRKLPPPPKGE